MALAIVTAAQPTLPNVIRQRWSNVQSFQLTYRSISERIDPATGNATKRAESEISFSGHRITQNFRDRNSHVVGDRKQIRESEYDGTTIQNHFEEWRGDERVKDENHVFRGELKKNQTYSAMTYVAMLMQLGSIPDESNSTYSPDRLFWTPDPSFVKSVRSTLNSHEVVWYPIGRSLLLYYTTKFDNSGRIVEVQLRESLEDGQSKLMQEIKYAYAKNLHFADHWTILSYDRKSRKLANRETVKRIDESVNFRIPDSGPSLLEGKAVSVVELAGDKPAGKDVRIESNFRVENGRVKSGASRWPWVFGILSIVMAIGCVLAWRYSKRQIRTNQNSNSEGTT
jgi:hypothetical protein